MYDLHLLVFLSFMCNFSLLCFHLPKGQASITFKGYFTCHCCQRRVFLTLEQELRYLPTFLASSAWNVLSRFTVFLVCVCRGHLWTHSAISMTQVIAKGNSRYSLYLYALNCKRLSGSFKLIYSSQNKRKHNKAASTMYVFTSKFYSTTSTVKKS